MAVVIATSVLISVLAVLVLPSEVALGLDSVAG